MEPQVTGGGPAPRGTECRAKPLPLCAQVSAILDLDETSRAAARPHQEVGRIPSHSSIVFKSDRHRLRCDLRTRVSVTKSRSSALSCSTQPVDAGRKPVTCDRLLSGMRRKPNSIQSEHQFAFTAHLMADSQLRHNIRTPKQRKRLGNPKPPIRELRSTDSNLDKAAAHQSLTFALFREALRRFRLCRI